MTDDRLETRLRAWHLSDLPEVAPPDLRTEVLAIPDVHPLRLPGRRATRPATWLAVAAVLVVGTIVASAIVSGLRAPELPPAPTARLVIPSVIPEPSVVPTTAPVTTPLPTDGATKPSLMPATGIGPGGTMLFPRAVHTATLLPDGRVLIVGGLGFGGQPVATAEVWDPATQRFSAAGDLNEPRIGHAAAPLPDGRVLIVGGGLASGKPTRTAEIWDPATGSFRDIGALQHARTSGVLAVPLADGRVAVIAGVACNFSGEHHPDPSLPDCRRSGTEVEIFDPASTTFQEAGETLEDRTWESAVRTADGRILIVGSGGLPTGGSELYDPATGSSQFVGRTSTDRTGGTTLTLLPDGTVLLVGGEWDALETDTGHGGLSRAGELWDPVSGGFTAAGDLAIARSRHTATLLPDGRVLILGGNGLRVRDYKDPAVAGIEAWDPTTRSFGLLANLTTARAAHTATLLPNGLILVVGGWTGLDSAEPIGLAADAEMITPGR